MSQDYPINIPILNNIILTVKDQYQWQLSKASDADFSFTSHVKSSSAPKQQKNEINIFKSSMLTFVKTTIDCKKLYIQYGRTLAGAARCYPSPANIKKKYKQEPKMGGWGLMSLTLITSLTLRATSRT